MQYYAEENQMYTHFDLMSANLFDTDFEPDSTEVQEQIDLEELLRSTTEAFDRRNNASEPSLEPSFEPSFEPPVRSSKHVKKPQYKVVKIHRKRNRRVNFDETTNFEQMRPEPWIVNEYTPDLVAKSVYKAIDAEFELLKDYKKRYRNKNCIPPSPRKRRDSVDLVWRPLSLFKIYTSLSPPEILETNYLEMIPYQSCFGQINMRMKRAWKRNSV